MRLGVGPDPADGDPSHQTGQPGGVVGVGMSQDHQFQISHRIPPETLDQNDRVRATINERKAPFAPRDEDRVTLADIHDHHTWARCLPGLTDDEEGNRNRCGQRDCTPQARNTDTQG